MARPRLSNAQHDLQGTYRADRHGTEPPASGDPVKPDMDPVASALWDLITNNLPIFGAADTPMLHAACRWFAEWLRWDAELARTQAALHAINASQLANRAWKNFSVAASRLGLSPADRAKLRQVSLSKDTGELQVVAWNEEAG